MKLLTKSLQLRFAPTSIDLALLVLRLWVGVSLLSLHGWQKFVAFPSATTFADPLGMGWKTSMALAIVGEVLGSVFVILGLFTRLGALLAGCTMAVAFFIAHDGRLTGTMSGEMAFIYLATFATLFIGGGGRFALDMRIGAAAMPKTM